MTEAIRTAKLASKILDELANFLKWEINSENDLNFNKILKNQPLQNYQNG